MNDGNAVMIIYNTYSETTVQKVFGYPWNRYIGEFEVEEN